MKRLCACGHTKTDHAGSSGPNSIGQWFFGQCVNGCRTVGPYRFGGCPCRRFRFSIWRSVTVRQVGSQDD